MKHKTLSRVMKTAIKLLFLAMTFAVLFVGGSLYSGLSAEYGHRGANGEYLSNVNTGIAWSAAVSFVVTGALAFLLCKTGHRNTMSIIDQAKTEQDAPTDAASPRR